MVWKSYGLNWKLQGWLGFLLIVLGVATMALWHSNASKNDVTGTISKSDPPIAEDGTAAHPYADASRCPASTDIVFWPGNDRPVPSMPSGVSVCFVGTQLSDNDGNPKVRDH